MILIGCVEPISMIPDDEDLPVAVTCILCSENQTPQTQYLSLYYVKKKSEGEIRPVDNAKVYINYTEDLSSMSTATLNFTYTEDGIWESERPISILRNTSYSLFVEIPGKETILATTVCPEYHFTGHVDFNKDIWNQTDVYIFREEFQPSGTEGTALWITAQEFTDDGWKNVDYLVSNHPDADDFNITEAKFSELKMIGSPVSGEISDTGVLPDMRVNQLFSLCQEKMPDLPLHKGFLRIGNLHYYDPFFMFAGPLHYPNVTIRKKFPHDHYSEDWTRFYRYRLHWVNGDLDKYFRSTYTYEESMDHYLTTVYSAPDVYTNIVGGVGIFGVEYISNYSFIDPALIN